MLGDVVLCRLESSDVEVRKFEIEVLNFVCSSVIRSDIEIIQMYYPQFLSIACGALNLFRHIDIKCNQVIDFVQSQLLDQLAQSWSAFIRSNTQIEREIIHDCFQDMLTNDQLEKIKRVLCFSYSFLKCDGGGL